MAKTFKPGQTVFYKPKNIFGDIYKIQAGIVKSMSDDGKGAFVWYHSGCTVTLTPIEDLYATERQEDHKSLHKGCKECSDLNPDKLMDALKKR